MSEQTSTQPPDNSKPKESWLILILKVLGVIAVVVLVAIGLFLGTCFLMTRGFR